MVAAIQSVSHVTNHNNPQNRSLDYNRQNPGSCAPSRPEQSTSSSMRICELKSNMQEHRLITSQWWKLLTDARGTTINSNGPQGTTGTIYGMWTVSWRRTPAESPDRRPIMKTSRRQVKNEMRCPQPDTNADKCHVQEQHTADDNDDGSIFPHHAWRVPLYFYTSLKQR